MHQHNHRWGFVSKEQRRYEHAQEDAQAQLATYERAVLISSRTHLEHHGRSGYLGFAKDVPALWRHSGNLLYACWVRRGKRRPYVPSQNRSRAE